MAERNKPTVVLVHGLWMPSLVFAVLRARLQFAGFRCVSFSYPSVRASLEDNAARLGRFIDALPRGPIHFVGHSLGGLLVLEALASRTDFHKGRIVLLGSPCNDCASVHILSRSGWGRALLGNSLPNWRLERSGDVAQRFEIGVLAGNRSFGIGSLLVRLPHPSDGVVCVQETLLPGAKDRLVLPISHSGLIISAAVACQVRRFIETGHFERPAHQQGNLQAI